MRLKHLVLLFVPLGLALLAARAASQEPAEPAEDAVEQADPPRPQTRTHVYDIRDLLITVRDYPANSSLVPPTRIGERRRVAAPTTGDDEPTSRPDRLTEEPGTFPGEADQAHSLVRLLQETVDPDSWRDNGGAVGAMRVLQGQLIVTTTPDNHEQLQSLLTQLRRAAGRMVTVRAHWVVLSPAELGAVAKPLEEDPAVSEVDLAAIEAIERKPAHLRGQITCLNSQTVHIASGPARTVVTEQAPAGRGSVAARQPVTSVVQAGTFLEVKPVLSPDGSRVVLDLQSVVSAWAPEPDARPAPAPTTRPHADTGGAPEIDRVRIDAQHMRMTLSLPTGRPILVGGMTSSQATNPEEPPTQMYLIVEVDGSPGTE